MGVAGGADRIPEAAATAGAAVKKAYPTVMVAVLDTKDGSIEIVEA
jgi:hypothetical protein